MSDKTLGAYQRHETLTADTDALTERIGRILNDEGWTFEGVHEPGEYDECEDCRLTVDPIAARVAREVAVEVRKAKAEAWERGHVCGYSDAQDTARNITRGPHNPYAETGGPR